MTDSVTIVGVIGTDPKRIDTAGGALVSFRLASSQRRFDRSTEKWVEGSTNWYSVSVFRELGENALTSLRRGERVIVSGRLSVRSWTSGERTGTDVVVTAEAVGHDLAFGTSQFHKRAGRSPEPAQRPDSESAEVWSAQGPAGEQSWNAPGLEPAVSAANASLNSVETPF
ncbi:single-stranded DNA-binding protein [Microbacteriaceae bacterium VKM Ac-2855]|nr:single-stranded DNA-binding protein [Microbacteriaceae bacterium VKM Ac-2855]